jgi:hypothetical protein
MPIRPLKLLLNVAPSVFQCREPQIDKQRHPFFSLECAKGRRTVCVCVHRSYRIIIRYQETFSENFVEE